MSATVRFELELEPSDPIAGSLSREGGLARPFEGWLSLMALLTEELGNGRSSELADAEPRDAVATEVADPQEENR